MHIIINLSRLTFFNNSIENPSSLSFVTQYKYANDLLCRVLNVTMYSIQVLHSRIVAPHGSRTCTSGIFKFDDIGNVSLIGLESQQIFHTIVVLASSYTTVTYISKERLYSAIMLVIVEQH